MPIKVPKKSNKSKTPYKTASHSKAHSHGAYSEKPFELLIDKIAITYSPPKSLARNSHKALYVALKSEGHFPKRTKQRGLQSKSQLGTSLHVGTGVFSG